VRVVIVAIVSGVMLAFALPALAQEDEGGRRSFATGTGTMSSIRRVGWSTGAGTHSWGGGTRRVRMSPS